MRYQDVYQGIVNRLKQAGIPEPEADAWALFEHVTGINRTCYFIRKQDEMPQEEAALLMKLTEQRADRIPVQHLTETQYFCGLKFLVNTHVLIPRWDTEILVEEVLLHVQDGDSILDLCTGSGCILLSIGSLSGKNLILTGCDISEDALEVARANADRLQIQAQFYQGDLFGAVDGKFDLIVSNPPYIPTEDIKDLDPEVKNHEPFQALDGKEDGLFFYRSIIKDARSYLRKNGWLLFEIGYDQAEAIQGLLTEAGFCNITVKQDLAGLDRVVSCQRP